MGARTRQQLASLHSAALMGLNSFCALYFWPRAGCSLPPPHDDSMGQQATDEQGGTRLTRSRLAAVLLVALGGVGRSGAEMMAWPAGIN
jgi:hypothetical protein